MFALALIVLCVAEFNGWIRVPLWSKILLCIPIACYAAAIAKAAYEDFRMHACMRNFEKQQKREE